jgi:hypothetical protein
VFDHLSVDDDLFTYIADTTGGVVVRGAGSKLYLYSHLGGGQYTYLYNAGNLITTLGYGFQVTALNASFGGNQGGKITVLKSGSGYGYGIVFEPNTVGSGSKNFVFDTNSQAATVNIVDDHTATGAVVDSSLFVEQGVHIGGGLLVDQAVAFSPASDPATVTDQAHVYGKDVTSSAEVFVQDEAGNATQISPHDPVSGEWYYYSVNKKTGRIVRVDLERFFQYFDEKFGTDFFQENKQLEASARVLPALRGRFPRHEVQR